MKLNIKFDPRDGHKDRGAERAVMSICADMKPAETTAAEVCVRNLSSHGFMAETDIHFPIGKYVWLNLPGIGQVSARIIWALAGRVGGRFVDPIDPLVCFKALGRVLPSGEE